MCGAGPRDRVYRSPRRRRHDDQHAVHPDLPESAGSAHPRAAVALFVSSSTGHMRAAAQRPRSHPLRGTCPTLIIDAIDAACVADPKTIVDVVTVARAIGITHSGASAVPASLPRHGERSEPSSVAGAFSLRVILTAAPEVSASAT
jgi:hypothetical protein